MSNEIKLNGIINLQAISGTSQIHKEGIKSAKSNESEDIKISGQLEQLIKTMTADNQMPDHHQRINALKEQIQHKQYRIDMDLLSEKLTQALTNHK